MVFLSGLVFVWFSILGLQQLVVGERKEEKEREVES